MNNDELIKYITDNYGKIAIKNIIKNCNITNHHFNKIRTELGLKKRTIIKPNISEITQNKPQITIKKNNKIFYNNMNNINEEYDEYIKDIPEININVDNKIDSNTISDNKQIEENIVNNINTDNDVNSDNKQIEENIVNNVEEININSDNEQTEENIVNNVEEININNDNEQKEENILGDENLEQDNNNYLENINMDNKEQEKEQEQQEQEQEKQQQEQQQEQQNIDLITELNKLNDFNNVCESNEDILEKKKIIHEIRDYMINFDNLLSKKLIGETKIQQRQYFNTISKASLNELKEELDHIKAIVSNNSRIKQLKQMYLFTINSAEFMTQKIGLKTNGLSYHLLQNNELDEIIKEIEIKNRDKIEQYQTPEYRLLQLTLISIAQTHNHNKTMELKDTLFNKNIPNDIDQKFSDL